MSKSNEIYENTSPGELVAILRKRVEGTFSDLMGMRILKYHKGYCLSEFIIKPGHRNPLGSVHGGCLFTIADTTAGTASILLGSDSTVTTIDGNIQFLNPVLDCEVVYAEANVVKSGKRIVYTDVAVRDEDGKIFAKGSFTFARIRLPHVVMPKTEGGKA
ncbi:MAG: PaaI family thioesterase [Lachnospiraceae bacterium]